MYDMKIGPRLKACHKKAQVSADALAEFADISAEHLRALEAGRESPSVETFYKLADRLGVPPSALLTDTPPDFPSFPFPEIVKLERELLNMTAQILQIINHEPVDEMAFHARIRQRRIARGYNVKQFAAAVGVSYNQISQIERGVSKPSFAVFLAILNVLRERPEAFFREQYDLCALASLQEIYTRCTKTATPKRMLFASAIVSSIIENET